MFGVLAGSWQVLDVDFRGPWQVPGGFQAGCGRRFYSWQRPGGFWKMILRVPSGSQQILEGGRGGFPAAVIGSWRAPGRVFRVLVAYVFQCPWDLSLLLLSWPQGVPSGFFMGIRSGLSTIVL